MGLNAQIESLSYPAGTEFPGTIQALSDLMVQYFQITGLESFNGVNYGPVTPDEDNRDKPWFKTDESYNPIGWYSWNGSAWTPIPMILPIGPTATRPLSPVEGQEYFDTDINVALVYQRSAWRTLAGSPGDVKEVKAATLDDALTANPGWVQDVDSINCVVGGADISDGTGSAGAHAYGETEGADTVTLVTDNLPAFELPLLTGWAPFPGAFQNGTQGPGIFPITTGEATTSNTGTLVTDNTPVSVLQPTIYYWRLLKS